MVRMVMGNELSGPCAVEDHRDETLSISARHRIDKHGLLLALDERIVREQRAGVRAQDFHLERLWLGVDCHGNEAQAKHDLSKHAASSAGRHGGRTPVEES
jgi:hypothetical protein